MTLSYESPPQRSSLTTVLCWLVIAGFVAFTAWSQWKNARRAALVASTSQTLPNLGLEATGRLAVAQAQVLAGDNSKQGQANADNLRKQLHQNIEILAVSPLDKLKSVVIVRELQGNDAALLELAHQRTTLGPYPKLMTDADILQTIYTDGPQALATDARAKLITDLGWFGELAATQGQPPTNPDRAAVLRTARHFFLSMMGALSLIVGMGFLGFLLLIFLIVLFALGKLHFKYQPVSPVGPPVFLETFALWGMGYLALSFGLRRWRNDWFILLFEALFLAGTFCIALWPLLRGMTWAQLRQAMGWHRGAGILTEMGAGALGYIAGLPLLAVGFIIMLILSRWANVSPTHPVQQEFAGALPFSKIMTLLLAISFAAPLLEETMFRGALYGHMRRRWRPLASAALVSFIFAAIHPQGWVAIPVLGAIAMVLAMLREWRGSLLASITAHGINNAVALLFVVFVLK